MHSLWNRSSKRVESRMKAVIAAEGAKSAPPLSITVMAWMSGLTLNEYVALATLGYIGLQALYLGWKFYREWKGSK